MLLWMYNLPLVPSIPQVMLRPLRCFIGKRSNFRRNCLYTFMRSPYKVAKIQATYRRKAEPEFLSVNNWPWNKFSMLMRLVIYLAVFHDDFSSYNGHDQPPAQLPTIVNGVIRV